jgi:hypothetical protein
VLPQCALCLCGPYLCSLPQFTSEVCPTIASAAFPKLQPHACLRHNSSPTSLDWYLRGMDKEPTLHLLVLDTTMLRTAFSEGIMKKELHNHILVVLFVSTLLFQTSAMGQSTEPSQLPTQVQEPIIMFTCTPMRRTIAGLIKWPIQSPGER